MARLFKRKGSNKYWIEIYKPGERTKPERISSGTSDRSAAKLIMDAMVGDKAKGVPVNAKAHTLKFWQLADMVIRDYKVEEFKTMQHCQGRLKNHILPFFAQMTASQMTTNDIARYRELRKDEGAAKATIQRELEHVRKAFTLAHEAYGCLPGPKIKFARLNNAKAGFFEQADFEKVMAVIEAHYRPFLLFAYITGWRTGEIKNLRRRHVDFRNRCVRLDPAQKNGDPRVFPFTDHLEALLRTIVPAQGFPEDYLFTYTARKKNGDLIVAHSRRKGPAGPDGKPTWVLHLLPSTRPVGDFGKAFATACYKAGLPCKTETWSYVEPKSGKTFTGVKVLAGSHTPHDFRRTAVRNLVNSGVPEQTAKQMCGHRTSEVFHRYFIVAQTDLDIAAAKMNEAQKDLKGLDANRNAGTVAGTVSRFGVAK